MKYVGMLDKDVDLSKMVDASFGRPTCRIERRLHAKDFAPAIDLERALEPARLITGRDDAEAHLETEGS